MKNESTTIWPVYIDSRRSLSQGRKIAKDKCVSEPTLKEIKKACYKLHLKPEPQEEKSYPGYWYEKSGRVLVKTDLGKNDLLNQVAEKISENRYD